MAAPSTRTTRLRIGVAAWILGLVVGLVLAALASMITSEGSVARGILSTLAIVVLPVVAGAVAYRKTVTMSQRTRRFLRVAGAATTAVGVVGLVFLAGLIPVGVAMLLSSYLVPPDAA